MHSSTNQEPFSVIKVASMKIWLIKDSIMQRNSKPSCATTKSTLFIVSKNKRNTKMYTGKSMKKAAICQKAPLGEATLISEKIRSVSLAIVESEGIKQAVTQSVEFFKLKFHTNF